MKIQITITVEDDGSINVGSTIAGDAPDRMNLNVTAIGGLEIAKASLIAKRWGIDNTQNNGKNPFEEE